MMDVSGRAGVLQASMRACKFEPLPEMRTSSLLGPSELGWEDIVGFCCHVPRSSGLCGKVCGEAKTGAAETSERNLIRVLVILGQEVAVARRTLTLAWQHSGISRLPRPKLVCGTYGTYGICGTIGRALISSLIETVD
jgi:hypothetical protein